MHSKPITQFESRVDGPGLELDPHSQQVRHTVTNDKKSTQVLVDMLGIDLRSLAALRILLGTLLLIESFLIATTDTRPAAASLYEFLVDSNHIVIVPFALCLTMGLYTGGATIGCWCVYLLGVRHDLFTTEADLGSYVLLLLLFWGMFLPLGAVGSVDALRKKASAPPPLRHLSVGSAAVLIQIFIIYYSAGVSKDFHEWMREASALQTLMGGQAYPTDIGRALVQYPWLLRLLSRATFVLEIAGPLLLFVPGRANASLRSVVVVVFVLFHLGLLLCMQLGIFPLVCMSAWLLYLPTRAWNSLRFPHVATTRVATCQRDHSRPRNTLAAVMLVYITLSALLTWIAPTATFSKAYQQAGKQVCLYQQWFMFNTPSKGERQ